MANNYSVALEHLHSYNINVATREIFLHSYLTQSSEEEGGVEYKMATTFIKNLSLLNLISQKDILVHIHTIGGDWHDGMAIFNALEFSKSKVSMLGYASVSSMSSIILQAAHTRILTPDAEFMIHWGSMAVEGHSLCVESSAEQNKRSNNRMLSIYAEKCIDGKFFEGYSLSRVKNYIRKKINSLGDWWMTAEEAVDYGFADAVLGKTQNYEKIECLKEN